MKKFLFVFLGIFLPALSFQVFSQPAKCSVKSGVEKFRVGDYPSALNCFLQLENSVGFDSHLLYNIGTCYIKLDSIGLAVWYLQRAKKLNPSDADIEYNLTLAKSKCSDRFEVPLPSFFDRISKAATAFLGHDYWARLTLLFTTLLCLSWAVFRLFSGPKWASTWFSVFVMSLSCMLLSFGMGCFTYLQACRLSGVVVTSLSAQVYNTPSEKGTKLLQVHEGASAELVKCVDNWLQVKFPNGTVGWLPQNCGKTF